IQCKVKLLNAGSAQLRPNMRVPVRIVTQTRQQSLYVSTGPGIGAGKTQKVFVLKDGTAEAREVNFGFRTSDKVEVVSGLKAGEKVVISDMSLYTGKTRLKVK